MSTPAPTNSPALLALRLYADHNLKLVARAISYTAEAAVVFDDKDAAKDALETITSREDIASASILLPDGQVLASWRRDITTPWTSLEQQLARLILPGPVELKVVPVQQGTLASTVAPRGTGGCHATPVS